MHTHETSPWEIPLGDQASFLRSGHIIKPLPPWFAPATRWLQPLSSGRCRSGTQTESHPLAVGIVPEGRDTETGLGTGRKTDRWHILEEQRKGQQEGGGQETGTVMLLPLQPPAQPWALAFFPRPLFPPLSSEIGKRISKLCSRSDGARSHFLWQHSLATFVLGSSSFDKNLASDPLYVSLENTILQNTSLNSVFSNVGRISCIPIPHSNFEF